MYVKIFKFLKVFRLYDMDMHIVVECGVHSTYGRDGRASTHRNVSRCLINQRDKDSKSKN